MLYFTASLISLLLFYINVSFLPHVWPILSVPIIFLPFLVVYSIKDRTIFPFILAFAMGILYDSSSILSSLPVFTITFLSVVLVGKVIFANLTNYGVIRTTYILTIIGVLMLWLFSYQTILADYKNIYFYIHEASNLLVIFIFVFGLSVFGAKYFDYVEKTTSERFR